MSTASYPRPFVLHRTTDVSGVSGTGAVAEGVEYSDGTVALRWTSAWPTSVVFHDRGIASVIAIHGHNGATRVVYLDGEPATPAGDVEHRMEFGLQHPAGHRVGLGVTSPDHAAALSTDPEAPCRGWTPVHRQVTTITGTWQALPATTSTTTQPPGAPGGEQKGRVPPHPKGGIVPTGESGVSRDRHGR